MASELLKNKALIQKLKEPEIENINFNLADSALDYSVESLEEEILPQPKPQELFEERDRLRIESLEQSLQESKPFLMDESVDFIERENFAEKGLAKLKIDPTAPKDKQILVQEGIYFKPRTGNFIVQLSRGPGIKTTIGVDGKTMKTLGAAKKRLNAFYEEYPKTIPKIANPPEGSKKFLKGWMADRGVSKWEDLTDSQKSNFVRTVWPNVQKQSKLIANKIPASEMAKLLEIDQTVLDNARKKGSIFAKQIEKVLGKPVNLVAKAGGTLEDRGEMVYYDKPTKEQIKSLKTYIPKTFGLLTQDVTNRVRTLADDTEFMNDLKKIRTVDDVDKLKMLQKYKNKYPELNLNDNKLARSTLIISQVAGGNAEYRGLDNIKGDKVLSRRLNNMIENAPFGNIYKNEAYNLAMQNIDKQFGNETATFSKYRDKIKSEFKRLGFKDFTKFNLDEYVGTSIGGFKGAGQYSVFSRLLAADVNQKSGASYLGRLSQATDKLEAALAAGDKKLAREIVEKNMADALRTTKKTKNSLPYLSLKPPGSKENFGLKRLNQLEAQGLNFKEFYKDRGFGFTGLKGAMTQKEIISALEKIPTDTDSKTIARKLASFGFKCAASEGGACDNPMNYLEDIKKQQAIAKGSGNAAASAAKKLSAGRAIFREVLGPAALGFELAAAVPITYLGYKAGLPPARIISNATYGLFGDTETARLKKIAVKEGIDTTDIQKALDFEKATGAMQTLASQEQDFRAPDDEMLFPQQYEKGEEDFYKAVGAFRDKEGNISKEVFQTISDQLKNIRGIAADEDEALKAEREAKIDRTGIGEYLTEGIIPEEEPILPVFDFQEESTRMDYSEGSPKDPSRRTFLKFMAGIASLPFVGKFFKGAKSAKVVKLANTTTKMPDWFPAFVDKAFEKGIAKKIDADLTELTIPELPGVKVEVRTDGKVFVEGKNAYDEPYQIEYEPPGYEVLDYETGKAVKTKGDFTASDTQFYRTGDPREMDYDVDFNTVKDVDDILGGDSTKLEGFAKGTNKEKYTKGQRAVDEADARADVYEGPDIDMSDYED